MLRGLTTKIRLALYVTLDNQSEARPGFRTLAVEGFGVFEGPDLSKAQVPKLQH